MSFQAMAWAVRLKLPAREKFVLLMLANYASNDAGDCYPSLNRLCDDTSMARNTVISALQALERAGALQIVRRQQDGVNLPNVYRLNLAWGDSAPVELPVRVAHGGGAPVEPKPITQPITKKKESARTREKVAWEDGAGFVVPASVMATFEDAYGARCDLRAEVAKATAWCRANPQRAPRRDYGRFLNAWLSRAAERPAVTRVAAPPPQSRDERRAAFMAGLFDGGFSDVVDVDTVPAA
jgi:biotin operon repressor